MQEEIWKPVKGYEEAYEVSSLGRVKSLARYVPNPLHGMIFRKERILKSIPNNQKYLQVSLSKDGSYRMTKIHQLVAMAFLNHIPCGLKKVVDHIDNNRSNNKLSNLQLISFRENTYKDKKGFTSAYPGVSYDKARDKWVVRIYINERSVYIGRYINEEKAAKMYMLAIEKIEMFDGDTSDFRKLLKTI